MGVTEVSKVKDQGRRRTRRGQAVIEVSAVAAVIVTAQVIEEGGAVGQALCGGLQPEAEHGSSP